MKRRDNIKLLFASGVGAGLLMNQSCKPEEKSSTKSAGQNGLYGRTEEEILVDKKLHAETFFTPDERKTIEILSDIIIPKDEVSGSATEAGVPDFIEFMMKDQASNQLPMRGGLKWLDNQCLKHHKNSFSNCTKEQQLALVDLIAFPDKASSEMKPGVKFFNHLRNLVATGFYTSQLGIKDIGYLGNRPNEWDGVPDEVLKKHGLSYDEKYKDVYVKPSERNTLMTWE